MLIVKKFLHINLLIFLMVAFLSLLFFVLHYVFKEELGDVGEWFSGISTFLAVIVSLYLANKSDKSNLKIQTRFYNGEINAEVVNLGSGTDSVKIRIVFDKRTFYDTKKSKNINNKKDLDLLSDVISKCSVCSDEYGNHFPYDYNRRYEIKGKHSVQMNLQVSLLKHELDKLDKINRSGDSSSSKIYLECTDIKNNLLYKPLFTNFTEINVTKNI